jgi:hypothetical protein
MHGEGSQLAIEASRYTKLSLISDTSDNFILVVINRQTEHIFLAYIYYYIRVGMVCTLTSNIQKIPAVHHLKKRPSSLLLYSSWGWRALWHQTFRRSQPSIISKNTHQELGDLITSKTMVTNYGSILSPETIRGSWVMGIWNNLYYYIRVGDGVHFDIKHSEDPRWKCVYRRRSFPSTDLISTQRLASRIHHGILPWLQ